MAGKEGLKRAREWKREIEEEITIKKRAAFTKDGRAPRGTGSDSGRQVTAGPDEGILGPLWYLLG